MGSRMTTPHKAAILEKAKELFMEHSIKNGLQAITPTESELVEGGFIQAAKSQLMRDRNRKQIEEYFVPDQLHASAFQFDVKEALANGVYVCGTTGSGKSDMAMMHADAMMKAGATVLVFDGTRDWISRSSIPNYVTIKPNQKIPIILNHKNVIFDMSLLNPIEQKEFVKGVCKILWRHQVQHGTHWYYLIFEEGHIYFPQGCMRSNQYASLVQLVTGGRNYKIRFEIVTQFSAMIDKNVMRYMRQRYCGYTDEPNDIGYVGDMIGREYKDKLKTLKAGQFLYKHGNKVSLTEIEPYQSQLEPMPLRVPSMYATEKSETRKGTRSKPEPSWIDQAIGLTQLASLVVFVVMIAWVLLAPP